MYRSKRHRASGMTLLEIMLTITLIAVLVAVVAPNFKGSAQRFGLEGGAREIASTLAIARQSAVSTQRQVHVVFDVNGDNYSIDLNRDEDEDESIRKAREGAATDVLLEQSRELPPKIAFMAVTSTAPLREIGRGKTVPSVTFYPNGCATQATILLQSERGKQMTVEVAAATGRVEVYAGEPRTFSQKLKGLGVDPASFGADPAEVEEEETIDLKDAADPDADRRLAEAADKQKFVSDVLSRLLYQRAIVRAASATQPKTNYDPTLLLPGAVRDGVPSSGGSGGTK